MSGRLTADCQARLTEPPHMHDLVDLPRSHHAGGWCSAAPPVWVEQTAMPLLFDAIPRTLLDGGPGGRLVNTIRVLAARPQRRLGWGRSV